MEPSSSPGEGSSKTVIHNLEKHVESPGPYDSLFHAICPQHPGKPRFDRPPRVPGAVRKHTPVRPVYDDFATAHSSITSGSAKASSTATLDKSPKKRRSIIDRGRSLSHRTHKSMKSARQYTRLDGIPRLPTAAKTPQHRPMSAVDFNVKDVNFRVSSVSTPRFSSTYSPQASLQKKASSAQIFSSLKKVLARKSSPIHSSNHRSTLSSLEWPRDGLELVSITHRASQQTSEERGHETIASLHAWERGEEVAVEREDWSNNRNYPQLLSEIVSAPLEYRGGGAGGSLHTVSDDEDTAEIFKDYGTEIQPQTCQNDKGYVELLEWENPILSGNAPGMDLHRKSSVLREGSTVDNIVKQYGGNDQLWNVRLESEDEHSDDDGGYFRPSRSYDQVHGDACDLIIPGAEHGAHEVSQSYMRACRDADVEYPVLAFKLTNSSGQAPTMALPPIPSSVDEQIVYSSSEDLARSSSYEDTRKLLEVTQRSGLVVHTKGFQFNKVSRPHDELICSKNPFRPNKGPIALSSSFGTENGIPQFRELGKEDLEIVDYHEPISDNVTPQLALDRDVSRALHRMSAFSNVSQETSSQYQGDGGFQSSTDSGGLMSFIGDQDRAAAHPQHPALQKFYHKSAIQQTWLNSDGLERIRIPIVHKDSASTSLSVSNSKAPGTDELKMLKFTSRDESVDEWETVFDVGASSRCLKKSSVALDNFNRAGSSLANTSDDGSVGPQQYEYNDFSSTERIIQHPAQIAYSHDYRYREMKEGNFPVLLPSYKPHTVNGFPANSFRSMNPFQQQPADKYYQCPSPLANDHTNPFRSPPPEIIIERQEHLESIDSDASKSSLSEINIGVQPARILFDSNADNWMDAFDEHRPSIKVETGLDAMVNNHPENFRTGNSYCDSRTIGSSIADASSSTLGGATGELQQLNRLPHNDGSKFVGASAYCDDHQFLPWERQPLVKGPPGAFYQGLRSQPESRRKVFALDYQGNLKTPQRNPPVKYPTNQMRPLSLLKASRVRPSADTDARQLENRSEDEFPSRSPICPIRSRTWRDLYTREQLGVLRNSVNEDRIHSLESLPWQPSRRLFNNAANADDSWKHLPWSPRIRTWPRENSSLTTNVGRKARVSSIVLCLCCLFPPLLVLYGTGYLDNMMLWLTDGEIRSFKKCHKRLALQIACFFIIAIIVIVPVVALRVPHLGVS